MSSTQDQEFFYAVLDTVLPHGGHFVVLKAYFDASRRANGAFCVAGYAFTKNRARKFDEDWRKLFRPYGACHMTDLTSRNGDFKGISIAEKDRLIESAVEIIRERTSYGVIISCNFDELNALLPKWVKGFMDPYPVCCYMAMQRLAGFLPEASDEEFAYFFESGDRYAGQAHDVMRGFQATPELKRAYRCGSHTFIDKPKAVALQAADMLAWEWAKFRDETFENRKRPIRDSLVALVGPNGEFDSERYVGSHIEGAALERWANSLESIAFSQRDEELMIRLTAQFAVDWRRGDL